MNALKSHNLFQRGKVQASVSSLVLEAKQFKTKQKNQKHKWEASLSQSSRATVKHRGG